MMVASEDFATNRRRDGLLRAARAYVGALIDAPDVLNVALGHLDATRSRAPPTRDHLGAPFAE
jgi:hypothetical protein